MFSLFKPSLPITLPYSRGYVLSFDSPLPITPITAYTDFLSSVSLSSQWLFPILVDVKDPMNFGAILRSSSFFGLHQLLLLGVGVGADGGMRRVSPVVSKVWRR